MWLPLLFPGFSSSTTGTATHLVYIIFPAVIFVAVAGILTAALNGFHQFALPAAALPCPAWRSSQQRLARAVTRHLCSWICHRSGLPVAVRISIARDRPPGHSLPASVEFSAPRHRQTDPSRSSPPSIFACQCLVLLGAKSGIAAYPPERSPASPMRHACLPYRRISLPLLWPSSLIHCSCARLRDHCGICATRFTNDSSRLFRVHAPDPLGRYECATVDQNVL